MNLFESMHQHFTCIACALWPGCLEFHGACACQNLLLERIEEEAWSGDYEHDSSEAEAQESINVWY